MQREIIFLDYSRRNRAEQGFARSGGACFSTNRYCKVVRRGEAMSEYINLRGVVLKPWVGSSVLLKWLGLGLMVAGTLGFLSDFASLLESSQMSTLLGVNAEMLVVTGLLLVGVAYVIALVNEIFDANHTIVD